MPLLGRSHRGARDRATAHTYFIVFVIFALYAPDFLLGIAARKTFRYNDPRQIEPEGNP